MIELNGLSKWKNQKLNIFQRVFPSGYPKEIKNLTFKKDESFKREILYILKKIDNKKFDRKENKKYFDIINKSFLVYEKQNKKINYFK